ncbi:hypothetical protein ACC736_38335, partial [Rhizobium ruizarguesonis]
HLESLDAEALVAKVAFLGFQQPFVNFRSFGIKGFKLSMVETAIEITEGKVPASVIAKILDTGRDLLNHPVETMPHVRDTLEELAGK